MRSGNEEKMKSYERELRICSETSRQDGTMADFLSILGFLAFALAVARTHQSTGQGMSFSQIILLIISVVMFLYIGYAMFKPEKF
jgi:hypothetical protein